mgnify:FL=1|uniref:Uncharacterized protein n=1 Tax=viral metagenome TaxID=1070528 RepID=A0A6C0AYG4_9ZZZZ|tara:strand:- start:50 stop:475 length:426 start_codon:yes stop_codon:yes gene_type:complete
MNEDEIQYLEKALNNENNESLINLTFDKIDKKKREIFEELDLPTIQIKKFLKKLEDYRYIEEIQELQYGNYFRWINLNNPENLKLTTGGILCEIKVDNTIHLVFKNNMNRFFEINMEENIIFQKFSDQERIILYALDHLEN